MSANVFTPTSTCAPVKQIANHFGVDETTALHFADGVAHGMRDCRHQDQAMTDLWNLQKYPLSTRVGFTRSIMHFYKKLHFVSPPPVAT